MGQMKTAYQIRPKNLKGEDLLENLDVDENINSK
jgi:hypothetical protein